jgi:hypothetical protein
MSTQIQTHIQSKTPEHSSSAETVVGFAVLGLLVAGAIGIWKALSMESGIDVFFCLLGSTAAFGAVYYIYFGKH